MASQLASEIGQLIDNSSPNVGGLAFPAAASVTGKISPADNAVLSIFGDQPTGIPGASPTSAPESLTQNAIDKIAGLNPVTAAADAVTGGISSAVSSSYSEISQLFLRGVVIILGFIFIAVGLTMFKMPIQIINRGGGESSDSLLKKAIKAEKKGL